MTLRITDDAGRRCKEVFGEYIEKLQGLGDTANVRLVHGFRCGSAAHNLLNEGSDEDYQGVFANCGERMFNVHSVKDSYQTHEPHDVCLYEIGTYVGLLFKGNPKVIEELLTEQLEFHESPAWDELVSLHPYLLNKVTYAQYKSYANSRVGVARKSESGSRKKWKMYAHALRLYSEAKLIVTGKKPEVSLQGEFREQLMSIRRGDIPEDEVEGLIEATTADLDALEKTHYEALPESADPRPFEDFLASYRGSFLTKTPLPTPLPLPTPPNVRLPEGSVLLSLAPPGPEGIHVGIYLLPTESVTKHIPKGPPQQGLESCIVLDAASGEVLRTYDFIDRNYSKPQRGETVLYELAAALSLIEKGNAYLLRGLYSGDMSPAWEDFVKRNKAGLIAKSTIVSLTGQLRGMAETNTHALSWALPFTASLRNGHIEAPSFTPQEGDPTLEELLEAKAKTLPLPDKVDPAPLDAWLHAARLAML